MIILTHFGMEAEFRSRKSEARRNSDKERRFVVMPLGGSEDTRRLRKRGTTNRKARFAT